MHSNQIKTVSKKNQNKWSRQQRIKMFKFKTASKIYKHNK